MSELTTLKNKADRLAEARQELSVLDDKHKAETANLRNEVNALKEELLHEFSLLDLKSFKAGDGTNYTVTPVKSIKYNPLAEVKVLQWAGEYNAVSLDRNKVKDLIKRGVELPDFIEVQETNTIRVTKPKAK